MQFGTQARRVATPGDGKSIKDSKPSSMEELNEKLRKRPRTKGKRLKGWGGRITKHLQGYL
jgi:hypothetical protein